MVGLPGGGGVTQLPGLPGGGGVTQLPGLPGGHHVGVPQSTQVLGHLTVDLLQAALPVGDQHLLHDGQLGQAAAARLDELHEAGARDLALAQAHGGQALAALGDADQLLVQGPQPVGAHHQLHQAGAVQADAPQHLLAHRLAEVHVRDGRRLPEEGPELVPVEEEVHDDADGGRVAHQRLPAAALQGAEARLARLAHHVHAQVLQPHVLLRRQGQEQLVTQQVVVQRELPQAVALVCYTQDAWDRGVREGQYQCTDILQTSAIYSVHAL